MEIIQALIDFVKTNWEKVFIVMIVIQNLVKGLRDALDNTPETDDNALEKFCTIFNKVIAYFIGFRAKKPKV